ncbi:Cna B-type domain-containing protein [Erysipelotrichaceae bacterium OH741_COT-311]|nr:Cna B-type domain-containing protein [Erysipelotrichaceae bacterium OH741_COT-311]
MFKNKIMLVLLSAFLLLTTMWINTMAESDLESVVEEIETTIIDPNNKEVYAVTEEHVTSVVDEEAHVEVIPVTGEQPENEHALETGNEAETVVEASEETTLIEKEATNEENKLKITLEVINLEADNTTNQNSEFWVETPINAAVNVEVSGTGPTMKEPWIILTVPKLNIIYKPAFVDSQNAYETIQREDASNWYVTYKFRELSGGQLMTFPFPFKFRDEPTRNGNTIDVKLALVDGTSIEETKPVIQEITKTYIAKKQEFEYTNSHITAFAATRYDKDTDVHYYNVSADEGVTNIGEEGKNVEIGFSESIEIPNSITGKASYVRPKNIKIVVHLPEGVEIDGDGLWKFDPVAKTATLVHNNPGVDGNYWARDNKPGKTYWKHLKFKNKNFNEVFEVKAEYYVDAGLDSQRRLPDRAVKVAFQPSYFSPSGSTTVYKDNLNYIGDDPIRFYLEEGAYTIVGDKIYDKREEQTANGLFYQIHIYNSNNGSSVANKDGGIISAVSKVTDFVLTNPNDKRIYYKAFKIDSIIKENNFFDTAKSNEIIQQAINTINNNPNKLYGIDDQGNKTLLKENLKYQEQFVLDDVNHKYSKLELEFSKDIILNNTRMKFNIQAFPSPEEVEKFKNKTYKSKQDYYASVEAIVETGKTITEAEANRKVHRHVNVWAYTSLSPITPKAYINNSSNQTVVFKATGTYVEYFTDGRLSVNFGNWGPLGYEEIKDVKVIQLLPQGFNFVRRKNLYWYTGSIPDPEVIENYKNTGRTAVIYTVPKIKANEGSIDDFYIVSELEATKYAERGNNRVDSFIVYPHNEVIQPTDTSFNYVDELDLDDDGDRNEIFLTTHSFINYIPPLELLVKNQVGYETQNHGLVETGDLGETFYYSLTLFNNTIKSVSKAYLIDVLPYKGDTKIIANPTGEYESRGSVFTTPMTRALEDIPANAAYLDRFEFFYQVTSPTSPFENVRDGVWLTKDQITNFEDVKSFKIVLKDGKEIASKEQITFVVESKIPYDTTLKPKEVAVNSAAVSTNGVTYAEGNKVNITFEKYQITGTVFKDFDKDGLRRGDEEGIENRKVELMDATTGDIAKDFEGNPIPAIFTKKDGSYNFNVYKRGEYRVRFTKNEEEIFADPSFNNNIKGNNIESKAENQGLSYAFAINPTRNSAIANGAMVYTKKDVKVIKVSQEDGSGLPNAEFQLVGAGYDQRQTSDQQGRVVFKNVPFGNYTLKEVTAPEGYVKGIDTMNVVVDTGILQEVRVENKPIVGSVQFVKQDQYNPQVKLENVKFGLFKANETTASYEAISGPQGNVVFHDVKYGTYYLRELETIAGYVLDTTLNKEVVVKTDQQVIDLGIITNEKIINKINFQATKTWVNGPVADHTAVDIELYRNIAGQAPQLVNVTPEKTGTGPFTYTWKDLPETDKLGNLYTYSVKEKGVVGNIVTIHGNQYIVTQVGNDITNTFRPNTSDVIATKTWVNGPKTDHTAVELELYRNITGQAPQSVNVVPEKTGTGPFTYTWKDMPETDDHGNSYTYRVKEAGMVGNKVTISGRTYIVTQVGNDITNTYESEKISFTATKIWENGPTQHPTILLQLKQNDIAYKQPVTLTHGTTNYTWDELPKTDNQGVDYIYTVDEVAVPTNYRKEIVNAGTIKNTYESPKKAILATKTWVNGPKTDHTAVDIELYRNIAGQAPQLVNVIPEKTGTGPFTYTWKDMPETDEQGNVYTYSVQEVGVVGNKIIISGRTYIVTQAGNDITNTYESEKISFTATKIWENGPTQHPSILLQLLQNGVAYNQPVTLDNGTTSYTWNDLPKTDNIGVDYVYSVDEVKVPKHYHKTIVDHQTIKNTYQPPKSPVVEDDEDIQVKHKIRIPKTGDYTNITLYLFVLALSIYGLGYVFLKQEEN